MNKREFLLASAALAASPSLGEAATDIPLIYNVDFQLAPPVVAGQMVGSVTATQQVDTWTIVADSSTLLGQGGFFSIDNSGVVRVAAAGASSSDGKSGYQGAPHVLTLRATNSFGSSPDDTGYATVGVPLQTVGPDVGKARPGPATVGYINEPGFKTIANQNGPGQLMAADQSFLDNLTSGTPSNLVAVKYVKFLNSDGDGFDLTGKQYIHFVGCAFYADDTSPDGPGRSAIAGSKNNVFDYCDVAPNPSSSPHPIPMMQWPSGGALMGVSSGDNSTEGQALRDQYMIPWMNCAQYGIDEEFGGNKFNYCNIWGHANQVTWNGPNNSVPGLYHSIWMHDARSDGGGDHTDGIGDLSSTRRNEKNLRIEYCTLAGLGGDSLVSWQNTGGTFTNVDTVGNYLDGYGAALTWFAPVTFVNCHTTDNVFGSAIDIVGSMVDVNTSVKSPTHVWRRNTFKWIPTSKQTGLQFPGQYYEWGLNGPSVDGHFVLPNNTPSATDYTG